MLRCHGGGDNFWVSGQVSLHASMTLISSDHSRICDGIKL